MLTRLSSAVTIIDIVEHVVTTISVVTFYNRNHQQNRNRETGFIDLRCDNRLHEAASVDFHSGLVVQF